MRKPPITFDAIFAALAVLSTTAACSKAERAGAEPASATPATPAATATSSAAAPPADQPATPPKAAESPKVDAGTERSPTVAPMPKSTKGASAACGATGCSAEMRKGGK